MAKASVRSGIEENVGDRQLSHFRDGGFRGPERHASLAAAGFPQDIAELGPEEVRNDQSEGSGGVIAEQLKRLVRVGLAGRGEEHFAATLASTT
jgi:hypothetical protein